MGKAQDLNVVWGQGTHPEDEVTGTMAALEHRHVAL